MERGTGEEIVRITQHREEVTKEMKRDFGQKKRLKNEKEEEKALSQCVKIQLPNEKGFGSS